MPLLASRTAFLPLAAALILFGLLACSSEPSYPPTSAGLYMARCSRCHEIDGSSTTASKLAKRPVDFRAAIFQESFVDAKIQEIAVYGTGKMQGVPDLSQAELDSIVLHIRRLGGMVAAGGGDAPSEDRALDSDRGSP